MGVLDRLGKIGAARQIAHAQGEKFRAVAIDGISREAVVGGMLEAADTEIRQPLRLAVAVEQDFLALRVPRPPRRRRQ